MIPIIDNDQLQVTVKPSRQNQRLDEFFRLKEKQTNRKKKQLLDHMFLASDNEIQNVAIVNTIVND